MASAQPPGFAGPFSLASRGGRLKPRSNEMTILIDTKTAPPRPSLHRQVKDSLKEAPHPEWVERMLAGQKAAWDAVSSAWVFEQTATGLFPEASWRRVIKDFFCVVEAFPKYMGLALTKTTYGQSPRDYLARDWLIGNIRVEAMHVGWYIDWAAAHDIGVDELTSHRPGPEVGALYEWLWSISYRGSLSEAVGAVNYAIEGTTGDWTRRVSPAFIRRYEGGQSARRSLRWLSAHAEYDDAHPREALEIVKLAGSPEQASRIDSAIRRSLELFARGFEASLGGDCEPATQVGPG
jgi:pyrroloquinoline quinone (PQQ) biosynthesis protein C